MIEKLFHLSVSGLLSRMAQQTSSRPWFLELVPLMVLFLIAAHVLALVLSFFFFLCSSFGFHFMFFRYRSLILSLPLFILVVLGLLDLQVSY